MKRTFLFFIPLLLCLGMCAQTPRHRILVSTDIGGTDPDDNQSMIHLLMYADRFGIYTAKQATANR